MMYHYKLLVWAAEGKSFHFTVACEPLLKDNELPTGLWTYDTNVVNCELCKSTDVFRNTVLAAELSK